MWVESGFGAIAFMFRFLHETASPLWFRYVYMLNLCIQNGSAYSICSECGNVACTYNMLDVISHLTVAKPRKYHKVIACERLVFVADIEQMWPFCMYSEWYHWFALKSHCPIEWHFDEYSIKPVTRNDDIRYFIPFLLKSYFDSTEKRWRTNPVSHLQFHLSIFCVFIRRCLFMRVLYCIRRTLNDDDDGDDGGGINERMIHITLRSLEHDVCFATGE